MTQHTKGPWSIPHFAKPDVNCECKYVLCDSNMGAVASVHCSGDGDDWQSHGDNPKFEEACANARLIAAAPELLEALQGWDKLHSDMIAAGGSYEELPPNLVEQFAATQVDLMELTQAAIAKAVQS